MARDSNWQRTERRMRKDAHERAELQHAERLFRARRRRLAWIGLAGGFALVLFHGLAAVALG